MKAFSIHNVIYLIFQVKNYKRTDLPQMCNGNKEYKNPSWV